jgi:hypothetical protein
MRVSMHNSRFSILPEMSVLAIPEWKSPQFNGRFFVK